MKRHPFFVWDPFTQLLLDRFRLTPPGGGLFAFLISVLYIFGLSAVFGIFETEAGLRAVLADFPNLGILLLMCPAVWVYYLWQPRSINEVFAMLEHSAQSRSQMIEMMDLERQKHTRLIWPVIISIAIALALSVLNIRLSQAQLGATWITHNWQMNMALQLIRLPVSYMAVIILVKQALASLVINRAVSRQPLKVILRHPDERGGIGGLGHYAINSASIIPIAGLYLGLVWAREGLLVLAPGGLYFPAVLIYLAVSPILLSWPILNVHDQMRNAKSRLLSEIAESFEKEYTGLMQQLHANVLSPDIAIRLRALRKMYQTAESAPEWPIDLTLLAQFIGAVLLPVVIPIALKLVASLL